MKYKEGCRRPSLAQVVVNNIWGFFVFCKLHVSQCYSVATNKANVTLNYISPEAMYPDPRRSLSHCPLFWADYSSSIRFHSGFACSDVVDSLEASRWDSEQLWPCGTHWWHVPICLTGERTRKELLHSLVNCASIGRKKICQYIFRKE